jgi:hypothetical protein
MIAKQESCGYDDVRKIGAMYICLKCQKVMDEGWILGLTKKQKEQVEQRK